MAAAATRRRTLTAVPPENSIRATHPGSAPHSFYSLASTDSAPSSGDACAGDVANVCQRVESGCYDPGSAIGHSDRVFGRDTGSSVSTSSITIGRDRISHSTATRRIRGTPSRQTVAASWARQFSAACTTRTDARPEYLLRSSIAPGRRCPARRAARIDARLVVSADS